MKNSRFNADIGAVKKLMITYTTEKSENPNTINTGSRLPTVL